MDTAALEDELANYAFTLVFFIDVVGHRPQLVETVRESHHRVVVKQTKFAITVRIVHSPSTDSV